MCVPHTFIMLTHSSYSGVHTLHCNKSHVLCRNVNAPEAQSIFNVSFSNVALCSVLKHLFKDWKNMFLFFYFVLKEGKCLITLTLSLCCHCYEQNLFFIKPNVCVILFCSVDTHCIVISHMLIVAMSMHLKNCLFLMLVLLMSHFVVF